MLLPLLLLRFFFSLRLLFSLLRDSLITQHHQARSIAAAFLSFTFFMLLRIHAAMFQRCLCYAALRLRGCYCYHFFVARHRAMLLLLFHAILIRHTLLPLLHLQNTKSSRFFISIVATFSMYLLHVIATLFAAFSLMSRHAAVMMSCH